jgi:DNA-binding response OmpR family regulator
MGGKDGMRAIREIKNKYPGAKIIVISALNENTIKMNDENISADLFITKPFTKEELLSVVNKIV